MEIFNAARMNRRELLSGAAALAIGSGVSSRARAQAETPKRGGNFRAGLTGASTSDTFDPRTFNSVSTNIYGVSYGNCLAEIDHTNKLVPELAESWESTHRSAH